MDAGRERCSTLTGNDSSVAILQARPANSKFLQVIAWYRLERSAKELKSSFRLERK